MLWIKPRSCIVSFENDTIYIEDSGGVNDHIEWTVFAEDDSGNTTTVTCEVLVVQEVSPFDSSHIKRVKIEMALLLSMPFFVISIQRFFRIAILASLSLKHGFTFT